MPFIPTADALEVVVKMTQQGVPVVNVYHVDVGAAPTISIINTVLGIFDTWITGSFAPLVSSTITFDEIVATDISVANGLQGSIVPATATGGAGGTPAAANAALVVSQRSNLSGRSFRGRTYIGGLTQTVQVTSHEVTTTYAAAVISGWQDLITALQAAGYILSILSKFSNLVARAAGVMTEIVGLIVNTTIDSQRRRTAN
jgi:hypothetical protein